MSLISSNLDEEPKMPGNSCQPSAAVNRFPDWRSRNVASSFWGFINIRGPIWGTITNQASRKVFVAISLNESIPLYFS